MTVKKEKDYDLITCTSTNIVVSVAHSIQCFIPPLLLLHCYPSFSNYHDVELLLLLLLLLMHRKICCTVKMAFTTTVAAIAIQMT